MANNARTPTRTSAPSSPTSPTSPTSVCPADPYAKAIDLGLEPELLKFWATTHPPADYTADALATRGHLSCLAALRDTGVPRDFFADVATCAARGGHLPVLQWAHAARYPFGPMICDAAAEGGHLEVLQWLRAAGCPWGWSTSQKAAEHGHRAVLQWLHAAGCPLDRFTCAAAAKGGHLHILQWLRGNGCELDASTCDQAARHGKLEVLEWARAHGCPWGANTCAQAALGGHLGVLQWAREHGCKWDDATCTNAARGGHLHVLQWAREHGCEWTSDTCDTAAEFGHLAILQWVRDQEPPCPWTAEAWRLAADDYGLRDVLRWLKENGCPRPRPRWGPYETHDPAQPEWGPYESDEHDPEIEIRFNSASPPASAWDSEPDSRTNPPYAFEARPDPVVPDFVVPDAPLYDAPLYDEPEPQFEAPDTEWDSEPDSRIEPLYAYGARPVPDDDVPGPQDGPENKYDRSWD